jgi:hypothetical protein
MEQAVQLMKAAEMASNHDNHAHDKENDLCSPFCNCWFTNSWLFQSVKF